MLFVFKIFVFVSIIVGIISAIIFSFGQVKLTPSKIYIILLIDIAIVLIIGFVHIATATQMMEKGNYTAAAKLYGLIGVKEEYSEARYMEGLSYYNNENYEKSLEIFEKLGSYKDSKDYAFQLRLIVAKEAYDELYYEFLKEYQNGNLDEALRLIKLLGHDDLSEADKLIEDKNRDSYPNNQFIY